MALQEEFTQAQDRVQKLSQRPGNNELLTLYALYKQATVGDCSGKRPGMLDIKGRAKFDAWEGQRGLAKEDAMKGYVDLVAALETKLG